jgi:hypothetical protein
MADARTSAEPSPAGTRLAAALRSGSVWERELAEHLEEHLVEEGRLIEAYEDFRGDAPDHIRYLIDLVLEDEHRHHRLLDEMCNRICGDATLHERPGSVPRMVDERDAETAAELLETTARFLALEREDTRMLRRLAREFKPIRDTTLLELLVHLMQLDTEKHIHILEFIRSHAGRN